MPFRIALSGLNAASADLRVVGNNVANANTTGFKQSKIQFSDIYAASALGASSNAVGSGVKISDVKQQFSQGNIDFTSSNLDLAINGEGFFRLNDNGVTKYSRAGSFGVDNAGFAVNSEGQRLTGYQADSSGNITGALGDIVLSTNDLAPQASTSITMTANLDASQTAPTTAFSRTNAATYNHSTSLTTYDTQGNAILQTMYFDKTATANVWNMYTYFTNPSGTVVEGIPAGGVSGDPMVLTFNNTGVLTGVVPNNGTATIADYDPVNPATNAANMSIDVTLTGLTQYGSGFGVTDLTQDGYTTGRLSGVDVGDTGVITARYTNGQSLSLAQVAMANFRNLNGLLQLGDTSWSESFSSGSALVGAPGSGTLGFIQAGALEGSNVDLTEQLVNMITAQRNFQSNAQVIQTADTITQTIINIR